VAGDTNIICLLNEDIDPHAGGTTLCWWYIPMLEVQPYADGTDAADPYSNY